MTGLLVRAKKKKQSHWGTRLYFINWISDDFSSCRITKPDGSRVDGSYDITDFKLLFRNVEIPPRLGTEQNRF